MSNYALDTNQVFFREAEDLKIGENVVFDFLDIEGKETFLERGTKNIFYPAQDVVERRNGDGTVNLVFSDGVWCHYVEGSEYEEANEALKQEVLTAIKGTPFQLLEGYSFVLTNKIGVVLSRGLENINKWLKENL